jgi:lipopolysaccharide transport system ATP-binding protein
MSDVVIRAEGLGKKYVIGHQADRQRYASLRDVVARTANALIRSAGDMVRGRQLVAGDEIEEFWALNDVSFEIKRGEVVGVIGRNGAGKSTLLKILSRITEPSAGRVEIKGRVASLLEVGTGFHPELTGRENIYLNGTILGMSRAEIKQKFDEIVAFADVEKFLDTPVKRYSSGMYVRLAFAVAAHLEPEILIVDEVLSVGDADFQKKCLGKMRDVAGCGRTVLFVSHQMATLQSLCHRAILIMDGRTAADGASADIVRQYLTVRREKVRAQEWKDRITNGEGRIVEFEVLDGEGNACTAVALGQPVRFRIHAEFTGIIGQPLFGILISTEAGDALLDIRSSHDGLRLGRTTGRITVEAALESVALYPGSYSLSPWVYDGLSKSDVDWLKHCATLQVLEAPGPHGDLRLDPNYGKIFVQSTWQMMQAVWQTKGKMKLCSR